MYISLVAMGTFVLLQYLREEGDSRSYLSSHVPSSFCPGAKDTISPSFPPLHHAREKKWANILLNQSRCNYILPRCELLGAQGVWGDGQKTDYLYHSLADVVL